jgi:hypothetical protein
VMTVHRLTTAVTRRPPNGGALTTSSRVPWVTERVPRVSSPSCGRTGAPTTRYMRNPSRSKPDPSSTMDTVSQQAVDRGFTGLRTSPGDCAVSSAPAATAPAPQA